METENTGTMRYMGIHGSQSAVERYSNPSHGDWVVEVRTGWLISSGSRRERSVKMSAVTGDEVVFVLNRKIVPHTLRLFYNGNDLGVIFDDLPEQMPLYPCITQQHDTDQITAEFDVSIPNY